MSRAQVVCIVQTYLRHKAIWHRYVENPGNKASTSKQKEIPVESPGLFEGKLLGLSGDTANILRRSLVQVPMLPQRTHSHDQSRRVT